MPLSTPTVTFAHKIIDGYRLAFNAYGEKVVLQKFRKDGPSDFFLFDLESRKIEPTKFGTYSPDGKILAIRTIYYGGDIKDTWILKDTETQKILTTFDTNESLIWNPDGTQIALLEQEGQTVSVRLVSTKTWKTVKSMNFNITKLVEMGIFDAAWSPDGSTISFLVDMGEKTPIPRLALYFLDLSSGEVSVVADDPNFSLSNPVWSSSSDMIILLTSSIPRPYDHYLAFLDVKAKCLQVYPKLEMEYSFAWLADGSQIVYAYHDVVYSVDIADIPESYRVPGKMCTAEGTHVP
jgi:Tol biopolymer transport system component